MNGVSMENVAKMLGHSNISMTKTVCEGAGSEHFERYAESRKFVGYNLCKGA